MIFSLRAIDDSRKSQIQKYDNRPSTATAGVLAGNSTDNSLELLEIFLSIGYSYIENNFVEQIIKEF